ncbi:ArnT family glycosyltransferase [Bremerella alba]|uniref:ArnT family glycosyltransferase n=1 Tax=Bremerella alba TaxID=980252 RepID=UPI001A954E59|nr:glycosyltransferase family 39 protein [Bremerella alba]
MAALLVAIFLFQLALMRQGHDWGGDFAQYLSHALNLATFQDYADTGYIYNPDAAVIGPRAYPPIFPLFLAPIYAIFGVDFTAFRVAILVLFVAMVAISTSLFARRLSAWPSLCLAGLLGFCPIFWDFNQQVISEHLFMLWWMLTFWVYQRYRGNFDQPSQHFGPAIVTGLLIYLAVGTRTVGIVLPPALLLTEFLVYRRLTRYAVVSITAAIVFYAIQKFLLPIGGSGYLDQLSEINFHSLTSNFFADSISFLFIWKNGHLNWLAAATGFGLSLIGITGFLKESWPRPQLLSIATVFYFLLVVLWPGANGIRMIWPLLPGFLFWILFALENVPLSTRWRSICLTGFVVFTLACYAGKYSSSEFGPIAGPESPSARELFAEVTKSVKPEESCLFFKPRVLAFYTQRHSVGYPIDLNHPSLNRTLEQAQADVVITQSEQLPELEQLLQQDGFQIEWSNVDYQLWRKKDAS